MQETTKATDESLSRLQKLYGGCKVFVMPEPLNFALSCL